MPAYMGDYGPTDCACRGHGHDMSARCANCAQTFGAHVGHDLTPTASPSGERIVDCFRPVGADPEPVTGRLEPYADPEPDEHERCAGCLCYCAACECAEAHCYQCSCGVDACEDCGCPCDPEGDGCQCGFRECDGCGCGDDHDEDDEYERSRDCACENCVAGAEYAAALARGIRA